MHGQLVIIPFEGTLSERDQGTLAPHLLGNGRIRQDLPIAQQSRSYLNPTRNRLLAPRDPLLLRIPGGVGEIVVDRCALLQKDHGPPGSAFLTIADKSIPPNVRCDRA